LIADGSPSFFTEYEAKLGQAVADPVRVFAQGLQEVWMREFDNGYIVVSSITSANFTVPLSEPVHELPLSAQPARLTGQREAPAWKFVIDNYPQTALPAAGHADWWADDAHRARFRTTQGNWTVVTDDTQSHQVGNSFMVSFVEPGGPHGSSQGEPGAFEAVWSFEAPANGMFMFSTTAVDAHFYPLTDAAMVCIREQRDESAIGSSVQAVTHGSNDDCLASGALDQRAGIRDGRWQQLFASPVPLKVKTYYEVTIAWDPTCSGFVVADALLVESERLYNGNGALGKEVVVGAMDARVVLKG
jgi:hypothetical protein